MLPYTMSSCLTHAVWQFILDIMADDIDSVWYALYDYGKHFDTLTIEDCIILHWPLAFIHKGYKVTMKCQRCACKCIYWLSMNVDIKGTADSCDTCQHFKA